jgi:hypothetical protein
VNLSSCKFELFYVFKASGRGTDDNRLARTPSTVDIHDHVRILAWKTRAVESGLSGR